MKTHNSFISVVSIVMVAFLAACGGEDYDPRCDQLKQKVRECFPGNEVDPGAMCSENLANLAGPILGADCGYLRGGKADDEWLWALAGLAMGGVISYHTDHNHIPWKCQGYRCAEHASECWNLGVRCPGPNGFNPDFNPGFNPGNIPWQCQAPQCQNQLWSVQQQCTSQGFPCPTWNGIEVPWQCQQPQCYNQPWNILQQCQNIGYHCNIPWQCRAPQCQNQLWSIQQQCASQGFPCPDMPWQCGQPQCHSQPWNVQQDCQNMGYWCN